MFLPNYAEVLSNKFRTLVLTSFSDIRLNVNFARLNVNRNSSAYVVDTLPNHNTLESRLQDTYIHPKKKHVFKYNIMRQIK